MNPPPYKVLPYTVCVYETVGTLVCSHFCATRGEAERFIVAEAHARGTRTFDVSIYRHDKVLGDFWRKTMNWPIALRTQWTARETYNDIRKRAGY